MPRCVKQLLVLQQSAEPRCSHDRTQLTIGRPGCFLNTSTQRPKFPNSLSPALFGGSLKHRAHLSQTPGRRLLVMAQTLLWADCVRSHPGKGCKGDLAQRWPEVRAALPSSGKSLSPQQVTLTKHLLLLEKGGILHPALAQSRWLVVSGAMSAPDLWKAVTALAIRDSVIPKASS